MAAPAVTAFLEGKRRGLIARTRRLTQLTPRQVGLRPQDMPFAPSQHHFDAANRRLRQIASRCDRQVAQMNEAWAAAGHQQKLISMAMVERMVDRARRTFGMFFEIF